MNLDALHLKTGERKGVLLRHTGNEWQAVPPGSQGQVLTVNSDGMPVWQDQVDPIPTGLIAIWSGSIANIPDGWALCDGNNGTVDLTDRFIVGAGNTYSVDDTGGSATQDTHPSHTHPIAANDFTREVTLNPTEVEMARATHNHGGATGSNTSSSRTHGTNLPPYYALAFIQKVSS